MTHNTVESAAGSLAGGILLSAGTAAIWPEVLHGAAVLCTGIITATAVFFLQRWLKRRFPDEKH